MKLQLRRHLGSVAHVFLTVAVMSMPLTVATTASAQGNPNPRVLPPNSIAFGHSYAEWSGTWWRWALSIPIDTNPVLDPTGAFAGVGQSGEVWFLAGNFNPGTTERTVTIPAGKALFFPIFNYIWINTPQYGDPPWDDAQEAYARSLIATAVDSATYLTCEIDGKAVANLEDYRHATADDGEYLVTLPTNNIFGLDADTYGPAVDDGFYLMLAPLSRGTHTIHFTSAAPGFELDVTYHITVR